MEALFHVRKSEKRKENGYAIRQKNNSVPNDPRQSINTTKEMGCETLFSKCGE
jgi:hypothetical protein